MVSPVILASVMSGAVSGERVPHNVAPRGSYMRPRRRLAARIGYSAIALSTSKVLMMCRSSTQRQKGKQPLRPDRAKLLPLLPLMPLGPTAC